MINKAQKMRRGPWSLAAVWVCGCVQKAVRIDPENPGRARKVAQDWRKAGYQIDHIESASLRGRWHSYCPHGVKFLLDEDRKGMPARPAIEKELLKA